jgi:hypothetical protein
LARALRIIVLVEGVAGGVAGLLGVDQRPRFRDSIPGALTNKISWLW